MIWLKKNWKWLLGAISTLGLTALFEYLRRQAAKKKVEELRIEESRVVAEIENEACDKKKESLIKQHKATQQLRKDFENAKEDLDIKNANRRAKLLEEAKKDPNKLSEILLNEYGIKEI